MSLWYARPPLQWSGTGKARLEIREAEGFFFREDHRSHTTGPSSVRPTEVQASGTTVSTLNWPEVRASGEGLALGQLGF